MECNLAEIIRSGFSKVASVIDANSDFYEHMMSSRVNKAGYHAITCEEGMISRDKSYDYMIKLINKKAYAVYMPPASYPNETIFSFGGTNNNKREIEFFHALSEEFGYKTFDINLKLCESKKIKSQNKFIEEAVKQAFKSFSDNRERFSKSLLHQLASYAISVLSAYETLRDLPRNLFVIANDHSPEPVAYAKIAKYLGNRVIYVQHAEVTECFPSLDFDYSILRNYISFQIYKRKGISGNVVYCDRRCHGIDAKALGEARNALQTSEIVNAVIYPSAIFNEEELINLIEKLGTNSHVRSIAIKPHPSYKNTDFLNKLGVEVLSAPPSVGHVAICGNSSVAIELIEQGNLVYNYFKLDNIDPDYYGFVGCGITYLLSTEDIDKRFWARYDGADFIDRLADYSPGVNTPRNLAETYRVRQFFVNILGEQDSLECKREIWFERDVFIFSKAFLSLLKSGRKIPYHDFFVIKKLNSLFDKRDIRLNDLYQQADLDSCASTFEFWLNTKVMEWNGRIPTPDQMNLLLDFSHQGSNHKKAKGWINGKCYDILLRYGSPEQLLTYLGFASAVNIYKLAINKKIAFINFCLSHPGHQKQLVAYYDYLADNNLSKLDILKVFVQTGVKHHDLPDCDSYKDVERLFIEYHANIAGEYVYHVVKPYSCLSDRVCFIDVKRNRSEADQLLQLVKHKLINRVGFSFIRLSDGEGFIFQEFSDHFTFEDSKNRQRHWWGEEIDAQVITSLLADLQIAVKDADILGIPSVYRFIRDHSDKTHSLKQSIQGRGLLSVLAGLQYVDSPDKLYTDDKANIAIFNDLDIISDLAKHSKKVLIINSGSSSAVEEVFGRLFSFAHIQVPTHNKTSFNPKYYSDSKPLPYVYKEIVNQIEQACVPGMLVLVGAGVAGKVFMNAAKSKGAVALDIGSAMDQYLGGGIHSLF